VIASAAFGTMLLTMAMAAPSARAPMHGARGAPEAIYRLGALNQDVSVVMTPAASDRRVLPNLHLTVDPIVAIDNHAGESHPILWFVTERDASIEIVSGDSLTLQRPATHADHSYLGTYFDHRMQTHGSGLLAVTATAELRFDETQLLARAEAPSAIDYPITTLDPETLSELRTETDSPSLLYARARTGLRPGTLRAGGGIAFNHDANLTPNHGHTGPSGSFAIYDVGVRLIGTEFGAQTHSPVGIDFVGGLNAVHASVRAERGAAFSSGSRDAEGFVAIPVVGTRISWSPSDWFQLSGRATTQAIDTGGSIMDLEALATLTLTESIDLEAGYQDIRGTFDVRGVNATLDESGVFARIRVQF
jgi:hypothetical protein